jgi:hypothetical protein
VEILCAKEWPINMSDRFSSYVFLLEKLEGENHAVSFESFLIVTIVVARIKKGAALWSLAGAKALGIVILRE